MERNSLSKSNKLKLFGVELEPSQLHETDRGSTSEEEGADESISSSSPSSTVTEKLLNEKTRIASSGVRPPPLPQPTTATGARKFVCSCCFKVFANPQALGGHQNAHKNEKMRLKKLQLQARNASCLNYYTTIINPLSNTFCGRDSENFVNFCGSNPHLNKEVRISFGSESDKNCSNYVSLRQNKHKFSVTDGSRMKSRPIPSLPESKRICIREGLDLHLGLGL